MDDFWWHSGIRIVYEVGSIVCARCGWFSPGNVCNKCGFNKEE